MSQVQIYVRRHTTAVVFLGFIIAAWPLTPPGFR